MRSACRCVLLALAIGVVGCGRNEPPRLKVYRTSGKLTVAGKPGVGLDVILKPVDPKVEHTRLTRGMVDANGNFQIATYAADDGAAEGTYSVKIAPTSAGPTQNPNPELSRILRAYEANKNALLVTIKPQDNNVLEPIDLK